VSQVAQARLPAAERRRAIVTAAQQVFGSGSYAGSTTAEIARAAGVSEPIIYRHFPSKKDLWFACLDEAWRELRAAIELKAASVARAGALADVDTAKRSPWSNPMLPNLWVQGVTEAGEDEEIQRYVRLHVREVHGFVAEMMRGYQAAGAMPADRDPVAEAWIFLAGGLLRSFADRLGGILSTAELAAIGRERLRWLSGG
jgi:AcrR family transcriptional regulator